MADKGKFAQWNHLVGVRQTAVLNLHNPTAALPVGPATGDRYLSTATAHGWVIGYIYQWSGAAWTGTAPVYNMQVRVTGQNAEYWYNGSVWEVISVAMRGGRETYLSGSPVPRAAEWTAVVANRHTLRRGRAAWAKSRVPEESSSLSSWSSLTSAISSSSLSNSSLSHSSISSLICSSSSSAESSSSVESSSVVSSSSVESSSVVSSSSVESSSLLSVSSSSSSSA